jgi:hypothetical protein
VPAVFAFTHLQLNRDFVPFKNRQTEPLAVDFPFVGESLFESKLVPVVRQGGIDIGHPDVRDDIAQVLGNFGRHFRHDLVLP